MIDPTYRHGDDVQSRQVREADPLEADLTCAALPRMNAQRQVWALIGALRALVPGTTAIAGYTMADCLAAMRDLGFILGSIRRHGMDPVQAVPEVVPVLVELGARTDMVPRDTVLHHCVWNPVGRRRRTYTGDPQERWLQDAGRVAFPKLHAAVELCDLLPHHEPVDAKFAVLLQALHHQFQALVASMRTVERVDPQYFQYTLLPYHDELRIAGQTYAGPSPVQLPLWLIDEILWAADRGGPQYEEFRRGTTAYTLPLWRRLRDDWSRTPSVVTRLLQVSADQPESAWLASALRAAAGELVGLLSTMMEYRGRQLPLIDRSERPDAQRFPIDSDADEVLLHRIVALTRCNVELVRKVTYSARPMSLPASVNWATA